MSAGRCKPRLDVIRSIRCATISTLLLGTRCRGSSCDCSFEVTLAELQKTDRYERRAWSAIKSAMRKLDAAMVAAERRRSLR